jgi:hypothetical protein
MPAIASRTAGSNGPGLEHSHGKSSFCEGQGGRDTGQPATNNGNITTALISQRGIARAVCEFGFINALLHHLSGS